MRITDTSFEISLDDDQLKPFEDETIESIVFESGMITECTVHEEISLLSDKLVPKSCEISFHISQEDWDELILYIRKNQKFKITTNFKDDYYNINKNISMGIFYLDFWERGVDNTSTIKGVGYLSILDTKTRNGGYLYIPPTDTERGMRVKRTAEDWFRGFFSAAGIPTTNYSIDGAYKAPNNIYLTGTTPNTTYKEQLRMVAFSIGAIVEEDRNGVIQIYPRERNVNYEITSDRIIRPVKETKNNSISKLKLDTYHYYDKGDQTTSNVIETVFYGYFPAGNHDINFDKPVYAFDTLPPQVTINNRTPWRANLTVSESGHYALKGIYFDELINPSTYVINSSVENVAEIKGNSLITSYNEQSVAQNISDVYGFYKSMLEFNYISNGEEVGWFGTFQVDRDNEKKALGTIVSQDIDVSKGLIASAKFQITGFQKTANNYTGQNYFTGSEIGII
jgi:hypothetical protein